MRGQGSPTALVVEARAIAAMLGFVGRRSSERRSVAGKKKVTAEECIRP